MILFILFSFISLKTTLSGIGVTQILIKEPSTIDVTLDRSSLNLSSYIYFSDYAPNFTYISRRKSEKVYLEDRYMFISNEDISLHIETPINPINLTIWIIPTDICSNSARVFKTSQAIFSHWVFTENLKKMCYFPINNDGADADITLLTPNKLPVKSHLTFYTSSKSGTLNVLQNITKSKKIDLFNNPFFISLQNAGVGTIFAYNIHFSQVIEDVCIDEPFLFLDRSNSSFISTFSAVDEPSFACSNDHDNFIILMLFIGIIVLILLVVIVFLSLVLRAYLHNRKIRKSK